MALTNADESPIALVGAVLVLITDTSTDTFTRQILYISGNANGLLLSQEACIDLGYVSPEFPRRRPDQVCSTKSGKKEDCDSECPVRSPAPDPPDKLPFRPVKENVPKFKVGAVNVGKCLLFVSYKCTHWLSLPISISCTLCCYSLE